MRFARTKTVVKGMYNGIPGNHLFIMAAGLSYYFIISLFPGLVFLTAIASYLPISDVSSRSFAILSGFVPPESLKMISLVLHQAVAPNRDALLSIGVIGVLWTASSAFDSLKTAIGVAYEAPDTRSFWITRPIAIGLTVSVGILFLIAFAVLTVGPHFGSWLASRMGLSHVVALVWFYVRWPIAVVFAIISVELLYFISPRKKQRFLATLPGAIFAVGGWLAVTYFLGAYYRGQSIRSEMYGPLAGGIAFMIWLYWAGFVVLVGAQLNTELGRLRSRKYPRAIPFDAYRTPLKIPPARSAPPESADAAQGKGRKWISRWTKH